MRALFCLLTLLFSGQLEAMSCNKVFQLKYAQVRMKREYRQDFTCDPTNGCFQVDVPHPEGPGSWYGNLKELILAMDSETSPQEVADLIGEGSVVMPGEGEGELDQVVVFARAEHRDHLSFLARLINFNN